jgi:cytochrome c6
MQRSICAYAVRAGLPSGDVEYKKVECKNMIRTFLIVVTFCAVVPAAHAQGDAASVYASKCVACHGADGSGSTPAGKAVQARDFHSADVQKQTDAELTAVIAKGKNKMPAYEKTLKESQIKDLVAYTRMLGKK